MTDRESCQDGKAQGALMETTQAEGALQVHVGARGRAGAARHAPGKEAGGPGGRRVGRTGRRA